MAEDKKVIGIAQVLQHLKDGMTRDDIAAEYGITKGECKILFQHEDLKGKKTIKKPSFVIVADATAEIAVKAEEVVADDTSAPDVAVDDKDNVADDAGVDDTPNDTATDNSDSDDAPVGPGNDVAADNAVDGDAVIAGDDDSAGAKATWD